jgi:alpha-L-fucosidase
VTGTIADAPQAAGQPSSRESEIATEKRLNHWFTPAKVGLFMHWGMGTSPGFTTVEAFEEAVAAGGWSAQKWVKEAKKIHARYITLATFHTSLGRLRTWSSDIPGTLKTKRDYLGELIDAAHKDNIKVVVYFTTMSGNPSSRTAAGDVEGYLDYARKENPGLTEQQIKSTFTLGTAFGFGAFSFDVAEELCKRHKVDGFWFDAYNNPAWYPEDAYPWAVKPCAYEKQTQFDAATFAANYFYKRDIVKFLHGLDADAVTFTNYFPPIIPADARGHEFRDKANWKVGPVSGPMPMGEENLLIPSGDWWYHGNCPPFSYTREIKRTVHTLGCGYVASVSEGPLLNGDFPEPLRGYNDFLGKFFGWAGESLLGSCIAGGHGKGGFPAGEWDDGAYGVTMLVPAAKTHYLHVLSAPSGNTLSLPDAGYKIASAKNLKTGRNLSCTQANGKLSITVPDWSSLADDGDYIIELLER